MAAVGVLAALLPVENAEGDDYDADEAALGVLSLSSLCSFYQTV